MGVHEILGNPVGRRFGGRFPRELIEGLFVGQRFFDSILQRPGLRQHAEGHAPLVADILDFSSDFAAEGVDCRDDRPKGLPDPQQGTQDKPGQGANLSEAKLQEANLKKANLSGANLTEAKKLTQKQLDQACGDEETKLPEGLTIATCREERE